MQIGTWSSTEPDIRMDHHHQTQPMYIQQNPSQVKFYPKIYPQNLPPIRTKLYIRKSFLVSDVRLPMKCCGGTLARYCHNNYDSFRWVIISSTFSANPSFHICSQLRFLKHLYRRGNFIILDDKKEKKKGRKQLWKEIFWCVSVPGCTWTEKGREARGRLLGNGL